MKNITAKDVKALRDISNAGMMDCKKALVACEGDIDKSIEWLRKKGIAKAVNKNANASAEGICNVFIKNNKAVIYEVNCETDFVSSNKDFVKFADDFGVILLSLNTTKSDIMDQMYNGKTIQELFLEKSSLFGENITSTKHSIFSADNGEFFSGYTHTGGKIAVLIKAKGNACEEIRNIAMHVAAMNPKFLNKDDVDSSFIEKEKQVIIAQNKDLSSKPENIQQKIIEGKIQKFLSEQCLVEQTYVRDSSKKIKEVLNENSVELISFNRYQIGGN